MNKNLEELREIKYVAIYKYLGKKLIIKILEGFEERLKRIEAELGIYTDEEIKNIKIGLDDPN